MRICCGIGSGTADAGLDYVGVLPMIIGAALYKRYF